MRNGAVDAECGECHGEGFSASGATCAVCGGSGRAAVFNDALTFAHVSSFQFRSEISPHAHLERCMSGAWMVHGIVPAAFMVMATPHWDDTADIWITIDRDGVTKTVASVPMPASGDARRDALFYVKTLRAHVAALRAAAANFEGFQGL